MNIQIALFNYRLLTGAPRRFYNYWGNYPINLRVSDTEPRTYLECFYTWDVPKQGGASLLAQFMRKYVNTAVTLWYGAKQPNQDRPEEVVLGRFHLNPGAVHLQGKRNQPSNWKNSIDHNRRQKFPCQYGQNGLVRLYVCTFMLSSRGTERSSPPPFIC